AHQHAGVLPRPIHALGGLRLRAGYARPTPPLPGDPASPAGPAAPPAQGPPSRLRRVRRRVPRHVRQPLGSAHHPRHADDAACGAVSLDWTYWEATPGTVVGQAASANGNSNGYSPENPGQDSADGRDKPPPPTRLRGATPVAGGRASVVPDPERAH